MKRKNKKLEPTSRLRNWQCGEVYHIYQRGNYKQPVFYTEIQLLVYLQRFDMLARRYSIRVHAFCLMSNHVHFVLETTRRDGISRFMQQLQAYHSRWIHGTQERDGHLWKNRFGVNRIKSPRHYRHALVYTERNPLAAGFVRTATQYAYSSAAAHAANSPTVTIGHGPNQATVHLYLDRWRLQCDPDHWAHWLQNPKSAALNEDLAEIQKVLGKDRHRPLNPTPLPMANQTSSADTQTG